MLSKLFVYIGDVTRNKTQRSGQSRQLLYFLSTNLYIWKEFGKTKGFVLRVVNGKEVTRKIKVRLTRFVYIVVCCCCCFAPKSLFLC